MAITLANLFEHEELALRPLNDFSTTSETSITWGAVTELLDPSEFLTGEEIVLTTGVRQKTTASQREFVHRLARNGVIALGFGTGLGHRNVPQTVVKTAQEVGLPVFEVPYETPFAAITKLIAEEQHRLHVRQLQQLLRSHQQLTRTLLSANLSSMLAELSKMLGTAVAVSLYGTQIHGPDLSTGRWHEVPVATGMRDKCTLYLAEPYRHHGLVEYAQSLIGLEMANKSRLRESQRAANGQILEDLVAGTVEGPEGTARLRSLGLDTRQNHVVILIQAGSPGSLLHRLPLPPLLDGQVVCSIEDKLGLLVPTDLSRQAVELLDKYLQTAEVSAQIGFGGSYAHVNGVRWSYYEALEALRHGERVNTPAKLSLTSLLLTARDVPIQDLAQEALGPLQKFDTANKGELLKTLREYFKLDGSVGAVAESLGLHRNTVRYRMQQITDLSGYDPTVTGDRVQLWIALSALELA
ncbi:PucR family transcriptional regulator ligand-binding domain-containing protein [Glutamicibacter sp. MNS18]|uniref:PucR family transcriptional regulator n=1 Tax=Glutamicibacter sp. MNS18 TaxID=2989817 RepID=UPI00223690EE|nr:PucR family transcriptional regulator [Glutamicibacter sp. MNS18]MCW4464092.1 PucR family transcriptional regulator ligand-binding domain-containing protein [Glutamicibacter sp. MNS18]